MRQTAQWRQWIRQGTLIAAGAAVLLCGAFGDAAEAGKKKKHKDDDDGPPPVTEPAHTDLENLILMLKDQNDMLKDQLTTLQTTVDNLPTGGGGGAEGNHTLRWDQKLNAANGNTITPGFEGCNSDRFKCIFPVGGGSLNDAAGTAVLDLETGLVWERSPATTLHTWSSARSQCTSRTTGGVKGWRLPSVHELASLVDPNNPTGDPNLPAGHPFLNVQSSFYWSATTIADNPPDAWSVLFHNGVVNTFSKTDANFVWCARSGHNDGSEY